MKSQLPPYVNPFPAPVILIGCGTLEKPNIITCSWFGTVASDPPTVSVSLRKERFSYPLIHETGEFTANIPRKSELEAAIYCGTKSGRNGDKFEALGLTAAPCPPLQQAPMIAECSLVLACKVKHELSLGSHNIFIAEVVNVHCDEAMVRGEKSADPFPQQQLVWLDKKYWTLTPAK